jgi:hypothetical protein
MDNTYAAKKFCIGYLKKCPFKPKVMGFSHCRILVRVDDTNRNLWFDFFIDVVEFAAAPNHPGDFYMWCKMQFDSMESKLNENVQQESNP